MSALRVGLLSTARINDSLLEGAAATDAAEVVAVASRTEARAAAYAHERGIPRAHGSYEALLADPEVDAVYVALPNALHAPWSIRALEAGKHVLCEKPLARTAAASERANPYQLELENLAAAAAGTAAPLLGRADAVGQARAIELLYASAA